MVTFSVLNLVIFSPSLGTLEGVNHKPTTPGVGTTPVFVCLLVSQRFSIKGNFVCQIFVKFGTRVLYKAPSKRKVHGNLPSDSHSAGTSHIS